MTPRACYVAMVTRGIRVMALAVFTSTRCHSFLNSGSRLARIATMRAGRQAAPHANQVEPFTRSHESDKARGNADDVSLDTVLISKDPKLVLEHLQARRMGEDSMEAVHRIRGMVRSTSNSLNLTILQHGKIMLNTQTPWFHTLLLVRVWNFCRVWMMLPNSLFLRYTM